MNSILEEKQIDIFGIMETKIPREDFNEAKEYFSDWVVVNNDIGEEDKLRDSI